MKAVVYHGPGQKARDEVPDPEITAEGDIIVQVDATTICGTDLVDTSSTPALMRLVASGQIDVKRFITHYFGLDEFDKAYDVFARAADTSALKVVLSR